MGTPKKIKKNQKFRPAGQAARPACLGLAGLLVVPCLGLVWPGPVLPALPAATTAAAQPPPAAEGGRLLLLARQARQAQARPSQGKAQQASQPSQGRLTGCPEGRNFGFILNFVFGPQIDLKCSPRAPGGPGRYFPPIFGLFCAIFGQFFFPLFPPLGPYFWAPY